MTVATITLTFGGTPVTLNRISEGSYSSEYLLRDLNYEYRMKIRHSTEKASGGGTPLDRHNAELTVRTFPTTDLPLGKTETCYAVIRSNPNTNGSSSASTAGALCDFVSTNALALANWATEF